MGPGPHRTVPDPSFRANYGMKAHRLLPHFGPGNTNHVSAQVAGDVAFDSNCIFQPITEPKLKMALGRTYNGRSNLETSDSGLYS